MFPTPGMVMLRPALVSLVGTMTTTTGGLVVPASWACTRQRLPVATRTRMRRQRRENDMLMMMDNKG